MSAGTLYWIRGKIVGSTIYATMWADGGSEPAPQITVTDGTPISTAGRFGIYASINTTATDTIFYDHFTATDTVVAAPSTYPRFIPRALGATIIPVIVSQPLPYIDRALGSTIIYEDRTFIPRALGGVYIPDTVMWVPRALGGTVQSFLLRSLTLAGRSEEHTSELQSHSDLVCRLLLAKKKPSPLFTLWFSLAGSRCHRLM